MAIAVLNAQVQACREGRHADTYAEHGRTTLVGGRPLAPGTRYCRCCLVVLPPLYVAAPDHATFTRYVRERALPLGMDRWLSRDEHLRGLGHAEIMIITSPHSATFPTGFMDTLRYLEETDRVTLRRAGE
ncbi:MAG: hypothetical protein JWO67_6394 [Streptosporangiaceae bacterium]|nr:hypothetical protein [Streptosporangiaceae bacterium]